MVGSATQTSNTCYTITPNLTQQGGAIWNNTPIDLTRPFDVFADYFLGCNDGGADGIVFVMKSTNGGLGTTGAGMGYAGLTPSIAVEFDTWMNTWLNDPPGDHIAIISNGNNTHNTPTNLAGPLALLANGGNAENCTFLNIRISWDPATQTLSAWVNCNLRISYTGNIVNTIFGGSPNVFWGFVGSTGAAANLHQVCVNYASNYPPQQMCYPTSVTLNAGPGTTFAWTPTNGVSNPAIAAPVVTPDTTGLYTVTVTDVCTGTRTRSWAFDVAYDSVLTADLGPDTAICSGQGININLDRPGVSFLWSDGLTDSARFLTVPDTYWVELSNFCGSRRDTLVVSQEVVPTVDLGNDTTLCVGVTIGLDATNVNATYLWQDGSSAPTFQVAGPGQYWAESQNICGTSSDTIEIAYLGPPQPFSLGNDTVLCNNNTWLLDATQPDATSYLWQNGSTAPQFTVQALGLYSVSISNQCGSQADTVVVEYDSTPQVDLGPDTTLCEGTPYIRNVVWSPYTSYLWQDNSAGPSYTITTAGTYVVNVTNSCGTANDALRVDYLAPPVDPNLGPDTILCGDASLLLSSGLSGYTFAWQDGSTNPTFLVEEAGTYVLSISNRCGTQRDSVLIRYDNPPVLELGNDTTLCEGQALLLNAIWSRASYLWTDGFTGALRTVQDAGLYEVTVTNLCGTARDGILVDYLPNPGNVDLGPDRTLCEGDTLLLDATQPGFTYQWQNGSQENSFVVRFSGTYSVRVGNECGTEVDQMTVIYQERPQVDLGGDGILCYSEPLRLDGTSSTPGVAYRWENGTTSPVRMIEEPGTYVLTVTNGCDVISDSVSFIGRECNCLVHVPSGFTPNGDAANETFSWAYSCDLQQATMRIFDRWGGLVFESSDPAAGWDGRLRDGRLAQEGVYIWVLDYGFIGISEGLTQDQQTGTVTLLR